MIKVLKFILRSSADPEKTSMTLKYAALGIIPFIMNASNMICEIGFGCMRVDEGLLSQVVDALTLMVFAVLTLISAAGTAYGLIRKLVNTAKGTNKAIQ